MIGITGFGRFGELTAKYLAQDFKVYVHTRKDSSAEILKTGAVPASLEKACAQKIVILCIPISVFKDYLVKISPFLKVGTLVVDVCSVKEYPVSWMREILDKNISILATHPMFGPDSAAESLEKRKIVLCNERIQEERYQKIKSYLFSKGLEIIETTPKEHDKQIAVSLSLTHFIGRSLAEFGATGLDIDTEGYRRLLNILGVVKHDTWQLFRDMHNYNRYAKENRVRFMNAMNRIDKNLEQPDDVYA